MFLAVAGSAVAGTQLGKNSVKARNIAPNAVTSAKVKDKALKARDFSASARPRPVAGAQGERGTSGPPGPRGAQRPAGPAESTPFSAGALVKGDGSASISQPAGAVKVTRTDVGIYRLELAVNLDLCAFVISLTTYPGGSSGDVVPAGMTAGRIGGKSLRVETRDVAGALADRDFEAGVAC